MKGKLNILLIGSSSEAIDMLAVMNGSSDNVFHNSLPQEDHLILDLLIIVDSFDRSFLNKTNNKTVCFSFDSSISTEIPNLYNCRFFDPKEGKIQKHSKFLIDTDEKSINNDFARCYGSLLLSGFKIKILSQTENAFFEPLLAVSATRNQINENSTNENSTNENSTNENSTNENSTNENSKNIKNPKKTTFHLIIALDCTGSMSSAITNIQTSLKNIVGVIKEEYPKMLISFYSFRDFCNNNDELHKTIFKSDSEEIINAISIERASGGGDEDECHKYCLAEIVNDIQNAPEGNDMTHVCFFLTDAPPHISTKMTQEAIKEKKFLEKNYPFAIDWIGLSQSLVDKGVQVFSFLTNQSQDASIFMTYLSDITHGLGFLIPSCQTIFEKQMVAIVSGLINGSNASIVEGINMLKQNPTDDEQNFTQEADIIRKIRVINVADKDEISAAIYEKGMLMRLDPESRGAKRVTITSKELIESGALAVKGLKSLYSFLKGDETAFTFFENNKSFVKIGEALKNSKPSPNWLADTKLSCICSMLTLADAFEELISFDEDDPSLDIVKMVSVLGNFIIGYPFLFQLNESGKFNMQDAWPIILKDATTAYTMSFSSLFSILNLKSGDSVNKSIQKFRDFVATSERSGIVPICNDILGEFVIKILDVTKWLDALVSYGLHRHIEPLPSITRATCCAFIHRIAFQGFRNPTKNVSTSQKEALLNVINALDSMVYLGNREMKTEFRRAIKLEQIPYSAFAPQNPYNCGGINKIIDCFIQLSKELKSINNIEFCRNIFIQAINENILLRAVLIKDEEKISLINSIFDDYVIDLDSFDVQNPLETNDVEKLVDFSYHEIDDASSNKYCAFSVFLFKLLWSIIRTSDDFVPPSTLQLTSFLSQALILQPRSMKYIKIENEDENANENENENENENKNENIIENGKERFEIDPMFAINDPLKILQTCAFLYFKKIKDNILSELKKNREDALKKDAISILIDSFRLCDIDNFLANLKKGAQYDWMDTPFVLTVSHSGEVIEAIVSTVKRVEPKCTDFYKAILYILSLGKYLEYIWNPLRTFRGHEIVRSYVDQFLESDEEAFDYYFKRCCRPSPNRHCHHPLYCPCQDDFTKTYAKNRVICSMAPYYFSDGSVPETLLPNKIIILILAKKNGAPPLSEVYELANETVEELKKK